MWRTSWGFCLLLACLGMVVGWSLRKLSEPEIEFEAAQVTHLAPEVEPVVSQKIDKVELPEDSIDSLLGLPSLELYPRLALWLTNATADETKEFYESYLEKDAIDGRITELIALFLVRQDPEIARSLLVSKGNEKEFWWAWAGVDSAAAFTAGTDSTSALESVVKGLGEFNPDWLLSNFDRIPDHLKDISLAAMAKWPDNVNPGATAEFLLENKKPLDPSMMHALVRDDPAKAAELLTLGIPFDSWFANRDRNRQTAFETVVASLAKTEPGLLDELLHDVRSPLDRHHIELARFRVTCQEAPAQAEKFIEKLPDGWLKDDCQVAFANHLLEQDLEQGFAYAVELLRNKPGLARRTIGAQLYEDGGETGQRGTAEGFDELTFSLTSKNPEALMEAMLSHDGEGQDQVAEIVENIENLWTRQDLFGYGEWVKTQDAEGEAFQHGVERVADELRTRGEFRSAMEWLASLPEDQSLMRFQATSLFEEWLARDSESAIRWRDSSSNPFGREALSSQSPDPFQQAPRP